VWYSMIPIIGIFFKLKTSVDSINYQSQKTGYNKLKVTFLWSLVMIITMTVTFTVPLWAGNNTGILYASHYAGIILAFIILRIIFRRRKA
jgi:choline-glycine betaine transporter